MTGARPGLIRRAWRYSLPKPIPDAPASQALVVHPNHPLQSNSLVAGDSPPVIVPALRTSLTSVPFNFRGHPLRHFAFHVHVRPHAR